MKRWWVDVRLVPTGTHGHEIEAETLSDAMDQAQEYIKALSVPEVLEGIEGVVTPGGAECGRVWETMPGSRLYEARKGVEG